MTKVLSNLMRNLRQKNTSLGKQAAWEGKSRTSKDELTPESFSKNHHFCRVQVILGFCLSCLRNNYQEGQNLIFD